MEAGRPAGVWLSLAGILLIALAGCGGAEDSGVGTRAEMAAREAGARVREAAGDGGGTPLHKAAREGDTKAAGRLLVEGAHVNATNDNGRTALHLAAGWGHKSMVELLVTKGAHVNVRDNDGRTPLHLAVKGLWQWEDRKPRGEVVEVLLTRGANRYIRDKKGRLALDIAIMDGLKDIVDMLDERGAGR